MFSVTMAKKKMDLGEGVLSIDGDDELELDDEEKEEDEESEEEESSDEEDK